MIEDDDDFVPSLSLGDDDFIPSQPLEGNEQKEEMPSKNEKIILNPSFSKQSLTYIEALNLINHLSGALYIYECSR